ncbi:hypothetical protein ACE193_05580 [Bernardetia sp. OM2101]|uniref:hypothetical protein n=1 Tax=Bernardetia sp. OM2101 TaxID=3344876 RepID=UPI0035CF4B32
MPEKPNKKIVDNYHIYEKVRHESKEIDRANICLIDKKNKANAKIATCNVKSVQVGDLELLIEASKDYTKRYGFKLMSKTICPQPFFRFDASGGAHNNNSPNTPLSNRQVRTPHFQYYDDLGHNTAYQTDELKNSKVVAEIEKDINKGVELFCEESVTFTDNMSYPFIERYDGVIFKTSNTDPLKNINFE